MRFPEDVDGQVEEAPRPVPPAVDPSEADFARATVFPAPLTTFATGATGALVGFASVYSLAALRVNPLIGVAVIVVLFALALAGPKLLADARTETGRAVAVILSALAFGGMVGGLVVILIL